jgi:23S rRNA (cytidine1920-2'-O)/16S rRNA (cytidine1409-2'-O)-methyltransferase
LKVLLKKRIDEALVERGILKSRSEAKRFIIEGRVLLNGQVVLKPNTKVSLEDRIELKVPKQFVSRGGEKLSHALDVFNVDVKGKIAGDIGASTGGFSDCLLQRGVKKIYAVDVGYGQFDFSLRNDPRIILLERTNARYLSEKEIPEKLQIVVMDVSFISITKILPALLSLTVDDVDIVSLIKPQFEGKAEYLKKGIIKDKKFHFIILKELVNKITEIGLVPINVTNSPIKGNKGNIEFFFHIKKQGNIVKNEAIDKIVNDTWEKL